MVDSMADTHLVEYPSPDEQAGGLLSAIPPRDNSPVRLRRATAVAFALVFSARASSSVDAEDIYKWTDAQGRVHYSNRGTGASADSGSGEASVGGEGWESVLERQKGAEDFQQRADAAINGLELQDTRRKRDRSRAQEELDATQREIIRASRDDPGSVPVLKARETTQLGKFSGSIGSSAPSRWSSPGSVR